MTPIITRPLSRAEAAAIFEENAVFLGRDDAIAIHRVVELFGEPAARFIEKNTCYRGYMEAGTDYNASGTCTPGDPCLNYYYFTGFLKVVSNHNHRLQVIAHSQSEGGSVWDGVWEERLKKLADQDAKDLAEAEARRQKRRKKKADSAATA